MWKSVVAIAIVGAACAAPVVPTVRRCAADHVAFASSADAWFDDDIAWKRNPANRNFLRGVKDQVYQHWRPLRVWQRLGAKTAVHIYNGWATRVAVSVARNGHVLAICVVSPSGIDDMDAEAVRAVWAAAPFRDPPAGLFEGSELVTFPFGFYYSSAGRPFMRVPM